MSENIFLNISVHRGSRKENVRDAFHGFSQNMENFVTLRHVFVEALLG